MEKVYEEINIPVEEELTEEGILIDDESNEDFNILVEEETSIVNMDYLYAKNKPSMTFDSNECFNCVGSKKSYSMA